MTLRVVFVHSEGNSYDVLPVDWQCNLKMFTMHILNAASKKVYADFDA